MTLHQGNHLAAELHAFGQNQIQSHDAVRQCTVAEPAAAIGEEVRKTWEYLESLRYFESGEALHVCILADPNELKGEADMLPQQSGLEYEFADIAKAAKTSA